ncbi:MAG: arginine--tRNA ligase [Gammaproteobacteria bacterium]|nr:arginine--tRNA ligase [Gammaproteobacteria bacterium]
MKDKLNEYFCAALRHADVAVEPPEDGFQFSRPKNPEHGDWSTNIAMRLSAVHGGNPRQWAEKIMAALPPMPEVRDCGLAGPGFINLYIAQDRLNQVLAHIHEQESAFGHIVAPADAPVTLVEYLSTNPTGPLHVGHGRIAVFGSALTNIMSAAGQRIASEYYINDAGRQIDILVVSVLVCCARQKDHTDDDSPSARMPVERLMELDLYRGDYLSPIATQLMTGALADSGWQADLAERVRAVYATPDGQSDDDALSAVIVAARETLASRFGDVRRLVLKSILDDIRSDLGESAVSFDSWFSEDSLRAELEKSTDLWRKCADVYSLDGALWFASTRHGDDKDRVLLRRDGSPTYFAMDVLYHGNKISRGHNRLINILGADHHGYLTRLRAAVDVLYQPARSVEASLVQFVRLHDDKGAVQMSTRSGQFVTLRSLRERIGRDALRFYFLLSEADQRLDFDLSLVVQKNKDNPLYYVQYACVRCRQVLDQAASKGLALDAQAGLRHLALLTHDSERALIASLERYPEAVARSAERLEPAILVRYVRELAGTLHANYGDQPYITDDAAVRNARLLMVWAAQRVLKNALGLLAVSVPEKM